uniref:NADH dehydrogenase subunit 6 n=1 Tax=Acanthosepion pharaonis TaxID=158019 RepID=M9UYB5_ACAPH|nr:NADH dehydrogenase subunit 6 [Sepia pharaonis]AGJ71778.1 NADH dehydrogenase subunit 6 [Sepia pharaonis]
MSLLMLVSLGFSLGSLCLMVIQPLSLGFMLMLNVVCVSGLMSITVFSWYGYILFLVYVGGMLVMFMYIISLVPNLIFLSSKVMLYFFVIYFSYFLVNYVFMKEFISEEVKDNMMINYSSISCMTSDMILMVDNFVCYILLGIILLFVLISVVKICYYCEGPLRVFKFKYA